MANQIMPSSRSCLISFGMILMASSALADDTAALLEKCVLFIVVGDAADTKPLGTGFLVTENGYAVTAAHVVIDEVTGTQQANLFCIRFTGSGIDRQGVEVVKILGEEADGRDIAVIKLAGEHSKLPFLKVGGEATFGEEYFVAGFPLAFDKPYPFPLIRRGTIASTRYEFHNGKILVLDMANVQGYSGAPVVACDTGTVLGVFRGGSKHQPNSDFSAAFVLSTDDLAEMESATDKKSEQATK